MTWDNFWRVAKIGTTFSTSQYKELVVANFYRDEGCIHVHDCNSGLASMYIFENDFDLNNMGMNDESILFDDTVTIIQI